MLLYSADLLEWKRYGGPPQRTLDVLLERNNTQQRIYCVISITVLPIIKPLNLKDKWRPFSRELVYVVRSKWKNASTRRVALSFLLGRATELRAAVLVTHTPVFRGLLGIATQDAVLDALLRYPAYNSKSQFSMIHSFKVRMMSEI